MVPREQFDLLGVTDTITGVTLCRMQRVVGLLVLALVLFWIISSPESAAATVTAILAILIGFAEQIVEFFRALV